MTAINYVIFGLRGPIKDLRSLVHPKTINGSLRFQPFQRYSNNFIHETPPEIKEVNFNYNSKV